VGKHEERSRKVPCTVGRYLARPSFIVLESMKDDWFPAAWFFFLFPTWQNSVIGYAFLGNLTNEETRRVQFDLQKL